MDEDPIRTQSAIPLDRLSEADLVERIAELKAEIAACEAELKRKQGVRNAADALFRSAPEED